MNVRVPLVLCALLTAEAVLAQPHAGIRMPDGKTVGMGQVTKSPEQLLRERRAQFERLMEGAEEFYQKKRWSAALENASLARGAIIDTADRDRVITLLEELNKEGHIQLGEAKRLYEAGKYKESLRALRRVAYHFRGLSSGTTAAGLVRQAKHDPKMQAGLQEARAAGLTRLINSIILNHYRQEERKARKTQPTTRPAPVTPATPKVAAGADLDDPDAPEMPTENLPANLPATRVDQIRGLPHDKQARVMTLMVQLAKLFPRAESGQRAARDVMTLQTDKSFMDHLARTARAREAKRALSKAQTYHKGGLLDKSVLLYRDVIKRFPDTPQAAEAKKALLDLEVHAESPGT